MAWKDRLLNMLLFQACLESGGECSIQRLSIDSAHEVDLGDHHHRSDLYQKIPEAQWQSEWEKGHALVSLGTGWRGGVGKAAMYQPLFSRRGLRFPAETVPG